MKVFLRNGEEKWILIHIEVQGDRDPNFTKRMFRYYYRIFDKFDRDIVAIALLTDSSKIFRPGGYYRSFYGTTLSYEYNMYKFMDQDEADLVQSSNPFAIAVLAGKFANEAKNDDEKRYKFKRKLFRMILQRFEFPQVDQRAYLSALIYFIDYLLKIPIELTQKLRNELTFTKEEMDMMYIDRKNPPPTLGEVKKEWFEEGKKQVALEMLKDGMSVEVVARYSSLPIEVVEKLSKTGN